MYKTPGRDKVIVPARSKNLWFEEGWLRRSRGMNHACKRDETTKNEALQRRKCQNLEDRSTRARGFMETLNLSNNIL
jgi:hypothetical protein